MAGSAEPGRRVGGVVAGEAPAPSEFELIAAIRERLAAAGVPTEGEQLLVGSGDDAAVTAPRGPTATTVDALVEDVHFRRPPFTLAQVGHKALATALSDLAAMGAEPAEAYVQLGVPERLSAADCLELADGLAAVAATHRVAVAGGDLTRSPSLFVAITAVGTPGPSGRFVRRAGAEPGDVVVVTGELGGAGAALLLGERPELEGAVEPRVAAGLRRRQLEPQPRLAAGAALAAAGATAMIDLSDGLGADAGHLARASEVTIRIELAQLPVQAGVAELAAAAAADPLELAAGAGEDYELLATLPAARLEEASAKVAAAGVRLSAIGGVAEPGDGPRVILSEPGGGERPPAGYDQLRR